MILFKKSQSSSLNEDSIFKIFTMTFLKLDCFFFLKINTINMEAEAIKRIKEAKDLFDTGILSQGEYDELVTKYKAIIMGN